MGWDDFNRSGAITIAYSASRLVLLLFLFVICCTLGSVTSRWLPGRDAGAEIGSADCIILHFFGGAALYALLFVGLGVFGLLSLHTTLILTTPMLVLARTPMAKIWHALRAYVRDMTGGKGPPSWVRLHLLWCTFASAVFLLLTRGLYPGPTSNDVWEHYLPYYREVLRSGSIGPNDLWYHFHGSKGAGLFHLLGSMGDELAAQLVSMCFILLTGLILYRMLVRLVADPDWALLGVILFFCVYRGDFFKHHDVLTGLLAFVVWASIEVRERFQAPRNFFMFTMALVAFYLGFYQPHGAAIVAGFWTILAGLEAAGRHGSLRFVRLLAVLVAGVGATMALNYSMTGLAEIVPLRFFWAFADKEKFESVFGFSGVAWFLYAEAERLQILPSPTWRHFEQVFRYQHFWVLATPWMALLAVTVGCWQLLVVKPLRTCTTLSSPYVVLLAFTGSALLFSVLILNVSLVRLYVFTTFLMTAGVAILYRWILNSLSATWVRPYAKIILLCVLSTHAIGQAVWYTETIWGISTTSIAGYFLGNRSFADVLSETDGRYRKAITMQVVTEIRRDLGPTEKIVNLGADAGVTYCYPGVGLIGGLSHTLGPEHLAMMFGTPEDARSALQQKGWNYFLLNLQSPFLDCLPFSVLFQPRNVDDYLTVAFQKNDTYLLTWRTPDDSTPIPARLRQVLEFKQSGVLRFPFMDNFEPGLAEIMHQQVPSLQIEVPPDRVVSAIGALLAEEMGAGLAVEENRKFVSGLVWHVQKSLATLYPAIDAEARKWSLQQEAREWSLRQGARDKPLDRYRLAVTRSLIRPIRSMVTWYYERDLGAVVAKRLIDTDERTPMAQMYASREGFDQIMGVTTGRDR